MKPFVVSPNAADDLEDIWLYLAEQASADIADRALERIVRSFAELAETPGMVLHGARDLRKILRDRPL